MSKRDTGSVLPEAATIYAASKSRSSGTAEAGAGRKTAARKAPKRGAPYDRIAMVSLLELADASLTGGRSKSFDQRQRRRLIPMIYVESRPGDCIFSSL